LLEATPPRCGDGVVKTGEQDRHEPERGDKEDEDDVASPVEAGMAGPALARK
jgi:hypothetical protein